MILNSMHSNVKHQFQKNLSRLMTKPTKWLCAQRRLRSAWAFAQSDQSSLSAWRKFGSLATHWAHSKDSDQTGQLPWLICVHWAHSHFVCFVMRRLISSFPVLFTIWKSLQSSCILCYDIVTSWWFIKIFFLLWNIRILSQLMTNSQVVYLSVPVCYP